MSDGHKVMITPNWFSGSAGLKSKEMLSFLFFSVTEMSSRINYV
jgi:hypothetical protein